MGAKEKTIIIDGNEVAVKCSAATYILYRQEFKSDLFADLQKLAAAIGDGESIPEGAIDILLRATYIMAKQATPHKKTYIEWADQFDLLGGIDGIQAIYSFLLEDRQTLAEPKKKSDQPSDK